MKRILTIQLAVILMLALLLEPVSAVEFNGETYKEVATYDQFQDECARQLSSGVQNVRLATRMPFTEDRSSFDRMVMLLYQIPIDTRSYTGSIADRGLYFTINYSKNGSSAINAKNVTAESKIKSVMSSLKLSGSSEYIKVYKIYAWITKNIKYDYNFTSYTSTDAIIKRKAYCEGYAKLMKRMCMAANIKCKVITNSEHAWNIVKIGGRWYYCDSCWDAGESSATWKYFLIGSKFPHKAGARYKINDYRINNNYPYPVKVNQTRFTLKKKKKTKYTLQWKKASGITGYQIRYKAKKVKKWRYKTFGGKTTKTTIKGLKSGVSYQSNIRTYRKLFNRTYYSPWK